MSFERWLSIGSAIGLASCAAGDRPESIVRSYAEALAKNRIDEAYALTSSRYRSEVSRQEFGRRYADPAQRTRRSLQIRSALALLRTETGEIDLVQEGDRWRVDDRAARVDPGTSLRQFIRSVESEDFVTAHRLLAQRWRLLYTPETLERDFRAEPLAGDRLRRAKAASTAPPHYAEDRVEYPLGEGRAVVLIHEQEGYRIAALE